MRYFGNNIKLIVNNLVVNYTDEGPDEGPVIIFIHGFPLDKSMWNNQIEILKKDYRVITYDIRGHGESDTGNECFSIDLFANDLIRLMDTLRINKASLCGLSLGGCIALNTIENYPERFDSLVLCGTNCYADSPEVKVTHIKAVDDIIQHGVGKYADESVNTLFAPESFMNRTDEIISVKEIILNTSMLSLCCTLLALSKRKETCDNLSDIDVPVLILGGEKDTITLMEVATNMHKNIRNSMLHIIGHAGHLSNLENPEEFNEQLKQFFAKVYSEPAISTDDNNSILKQLSHQLNIFLSFKPI